MASQQNGTNGAAASNDFTVKAGLAQMLKGGVIMDVVNAEQVCTWSMASAQWMNLMRHSYRLALPRKPVLPLSWPLSVSPPISELRVAWRACPTPA